MDQPGKVANPARGQLNRENKIPLSPCAPENLVSRDGFSRPVPRQPAHLHTQAESGAYLRDSSRVPRQRPFIKPPYAIGSVPSLSGHAFAYRWRSLPRVRRHRASKPQGSSERVLPWQVTMDQLVFASLSHTVWRIGKTDKQLRIMLMRNNKPTFQIKPRCQSSVSSSMRFGNLVRPPLDTHRKKTHRIWNDAK